MPIRKTTERRILGVEQITGPLRFTPKKSERKLLKRWAEKPTNKNSQS